MIERVQFKNFKALQDVSIEFGRFTVLVGANACGKSSVLQGIDQLLAGVAARLRSQGKSSFEEWFSRFADEFRARATLGDSLRETSIETALMLTRAWVPQRVVGLGTGDRRASAEPMLVTQSADEPPKTVAHDKQLAFAFEGCGYEPNYLQLQPRGLASPTVIDEATNLRTDGSNLSSVLAELALNRPDVLGNIRKALATIVPGVGHFRFPRTTVAQIVEETVSVDGRTFIRSASKSVPAFGLSVEVENVGWIEAEQLSEGTLLTLGLLTAMHANEAQIIMFDDLDRGLHPRAQAELIACLRSILEQRPDLQIICTTHSPYLLNHFEADEVRVMGLDANRHAHVRTLSEHPDWAQWKETMQVGEFWSVVGDDWAGHGDD